MVAQSVEFLFFWLPHCYFANPMFSAAGNSRRIQMMRREILTSDSRRTMMRRRWMRAFPGCFSSITSRHCRHWLGAKPCSNGRDIMVLWTCDAAGLIPHAFQTTHPKPDGEAEVFLLHTPTADLKCLSVIFTSTGVGGPSSS